MSMEALELVAERFKALSEPIRLRILQELHDGEMSVSEITQVIDSSQPNVSKHLKLLQDAGLLARRQEGNTVYYSISDKVIFDICEIVCNSLREKFSAKADALSLKLK
ncbi:MAG: winged helix-turn-helix transcriptional regulator [Blastocatellia bacterium]|nr:winged helix-turn-helix transcriptional regulator [Blastocatellia bacterium]MBL8195614.1 winged helix-turn-helix transcriptional regulator [Blastocatellia bacterium]MBN8722063.1 winged helix-turn-helix transcriptional regulator [Acidobacteriota bacterium]